MAAMTRSFSHGPPDLLNDCGEIAVGVPGRRQTLSGLARSAPKSMQLGVTVGVVIDPDPAPFGPVANEQDDGELENETTVALEPDGNPNRLAPQANRKSVLARGHMLG
jgi:hypothetical protein